MRCLLVTSHLDVGGISVYTVGLARALKRRGHELLVISGGGALVRELEEAGILHRRFPLRIKSELHPFVAAVVARLVKVIRDWCPDVLHAQTRVTHVAAGVAGRVTGVPVVTTTHGFYTWRWGRRVFPFWGRRVIAVSPSSRRKLTRAYQVPAAKVVEILNGIEWSPPAPPQLAAEAARFRQLWGLQGPGPVIGTIARLSPAKGHPTLLEAFQQVRRRHPEARLLIVGDGPEKPALIRQAYALGIQDAVSITGFVERTAVPLSVMDLFVLPSLREAFGLAIVEAMAMAKPVVASSVGGIRVVVRRGETGLLVPPRDSAALAAAIGRLLDDPAEAQRMGQAGRRRFEQRFTMDRVAADVEQVYRQVVQETRQ